MEPIQSPFYLSSQKEGPHFTEGAVSGASLQPGAAVQSSATAGISVIKPSEVAVANKATVAVLIDHETHEDKVGPFSSSEIRDSDSISEPAIEREHSGLYGRMLGGKTRNHFLINLWVLAVMGGFIAVWILGKDRTHEPEDGYGWQGITELQPFVQQLPSNSPQFLYVRVVMPPWDGMRNGEPHPYGGVAEEHMHTGYRRRKVLENKMSPQVMFHQLQLEVEMVTRRKLQAEEGVSALEEVLPVIDISLVQVDPSLLRKNYTHNPALKGNLFPLNSTVPASGVSSCIFDDVTSVICIAEFKNTDTVFPHEAMYLIVAVNGSTQGVAVNIEAVQMGAFGFAKEWAALAVIIISLLGIASEKLHRMW
eukprot:gene21620-28623_t